MSHPFHRSIAASLEKRLKDRRVVVFYDPSGDFEPFIDELANVGTGHGDIPRVFVGETMAFLVRYSGSYFALRLAVEPIVAADRPDALLIYLPGIRRDPKGSVLMELEKAGECYEPQLRRLALNELRKKYSDGQIDDMLAPESISYQDIVRFLAQGGDTGASLVKLVLGEGKSEDLLSRWLADESSDARLQEKGATAELFQLVQARLGFELKGEPALDKARRLVVRHVLVNEFRSDLTCEAPEKLKVLPAPGTDDQLQRVKEVAARLRGTAPEAYANLADVVEQESHLAALGIPATALGTIDTFRFEEHALLGHAATLLADGSDDDALAVVAGRGQSFWVDRDIERLAQWEACRLAAELDSAVARVGNAVAAGGRKAGEWVASYAGEGGWHGVDRAQRLLETWLSGMEGEPEPALEKAIVAVRSRYEKVLGDMAMGFADALVRSGWSVSGAPQQSRVFATEVQPRQGRVAYFLADALRYEMAADLVEQLEGSLDVRVQPALAALPTITPVGMAALMPGAESGFSVVEHKGKLASRIGEVPLASSAERTKHLLANCPDAADIDVGNLLQKSASVIEKKLGGARLLVVRSQSIDGLGEMDGGLLARQVMATAVGNLARAVRKLAKLGFEHFIVTADHGYQFSYRKEEDMVIDKPGGQTVDLHRRCWAGHGGQTPAGTVRVTGAELGYRTDLDFVFPKGLGVFPAGGSLTYHHGGISLQELVVPMVTFRMETVSEERPTGPTLHLEQVPPRVTNRTFGLTLRLGADLFASRGFAARVVLVSEGQEVGRAGMALDAEFDRTTATVTVKPGKAVSLAMILTRDDCDKVRVVALDPRTDAVLAQSDELPVKLGI